jgi:hypothetical protein
MKPWSARVLTASAALMAVAAVVLVSQGRVLWCKCGSLAPWSGEIWSLHNSQHFLDPYTFTHVLHGVAFFALLWPLHRWLTDGVRAALAVGIESAWEVFENSAYVINKYREATISLDYFGDSVANSMADVVAMAVGFTFASRVSWKVGLGFFVVTELALALWIRDSLLLNILMLTFPIEAVKQWQMGLAPG